MNSGTTLLLPVRPKSVALYMNKVLENLYISISSPLFLCLSSNAKAPRTMSVLGGFIRYFGCKLEESGKPYANRP